MDNEQLTRRAARPIAFKAMRDKLVTLINPYPSGSALYAEFADIREALKSVVNNQIRQAEGTARPRSITAKPRHRSTR